MMKKGFIFAWILLGLPWLAWGQMESMLADLSLAPHFESHRISSFDPSGGNQDWIAINPGETKVLAEIEGPGAITHIWNTIDAEKYYPRMLILRIYWDGQEVPSVEAPLGDFFGVGHGLSAPFQSFPVDVSSEGRARNCYWFMPFHKSAKVTLTHEGFLPVRHFYYYIDSRHDVSLPDDSLYFHAQYRQAAPNPKVDLKGKNLDGLTNYVLMETTGKGKYVGTVLSCQNNKDGWFGEGDDMFYVDGASKPTLTGTGTEDYFNDAWGFRLFCYPFHGVTVWEGMKKGDRGTAYKWHISDPVAFQTSLKATLEHGHANDREDDWYSVAFWYQTLPSPQPPVLPSVFDRLPDEGQLYTKRIFMNKEIALHLDQKRFDDALKRIDEFTKENPGSDDFGYWTLKKGMIQKMLGDTRSSEAAVDQVLSKSSAQDAKALEADAMAIHDLAGREDSIAKKRECDAYLSCNGDYEMFLDGDVMAKGQGWEAVKDQVVKLSHGRHVIGIKIPGAGSNKGVLLQISQRYGFFLTDASWKVSNKEEKNWNRTSFDDQQWPFARVVGTPGEGNWISGRSDYYFKSGFLFAKYIGAPEELSSSETLYFRKEIQVR